MKWVVKRNSPDYLEKGNSIIEKMMECACV